MRRIIQLELTLTQCLLNKILNTEYTQQCTCSSNRNTTGAPGTRHIHPWWPDLGPKWVRLAPNGTYLGIFQIRFSSQYILARRALMYLIWSEECPDLSHLGSIWPTLGPNLVTVYRNKWTSHSLIYPGKTPLSFDASIIIWLDLILPDSL